MPRILVVEEDHACREQIRAILSSADHELRFAANGREAIDVGVRFRPDVLVTNYVLRGRIHGFHVVGALRLMDPSLRVILLTAFASEDLKREVSSRRVFRVVEKPFDPDGLQQITREAFSAPPAESPASPVAIAEIDRAGRVIYANTAAQELFNQAPQPGQAANIAKLLASGPIGDLDEAASNWLALSTASTHAPVCELRSQRPEGADTWVVVLRLQSTAVRCSSLLLNMLLNAQETWSAAWPPDRRVLVIDDDQLYRQLSVAQLEGVGVICHTTESEIEALRFLELDEAIDIVLIDYDMPGIDTAGLVTRLRAIRPRIKIAGSSGVDRRADFVAAGVSLFVYKPWSINDLARILNGPNV